MFLQHRQIQRHFILTFFENNFVQHFQCRSVIDCFIVTNRVKFQICPIMFFRSVSDSSRTSEKQFLPVPSSGSMISTDPLGSIISDIEGRSGIESSSFNGQFTSCTNKSIQKNKRSLSHRTRSSSTSTTEKCFRLRATTVHLIHESIFFPRRKKRFGLSDDSKEKFDGKTTRSF